MGALKQLLGGQDHASDRTPGRRVPRVSPSWYPHELETSFVVTLWSLGHQLVAWWLSPHDGPTPTPGAAVSSPGSWRADPGQPRTDPTCPWLSFRKTMLNDLLRFDVKDCSWCRWVASEP